MALFRQFCSLEKANSSRKTNVYRCLTCRKDPGYYSSRFNDQFSPSLPNSGALWFCGSTKKVYRFLPPRGLKLWFFFGIEKRKKKKKKKKKKTSFQPLSKKSRYSSTDTGSCNTAARRSFPCWSRFRPWSVGYHLSSCNASDRTRTCWPTLCGSIAPAPTKKYVKHQAFKKKLSNKCPQARSTRLGYKTSSFPDHGACGRASIALRRARKVCTLCAARALSRFLFSVEPSFEGSMEK